MSKDYKHDIEELEFYLCRLYPTWVEIDTDVITERPKTLDHLHNALIEIIGAMLEFADEVEGIKEKEEDEC